MFLFFFPLTPNPILNMGIVWSIHVKSPVKLDLSLSPITYHLLPVTYYLLPITHYPLPITYYPLPITHYPLPIIHY